MNHQLLLIIIRWCFEFHCESGWTDCNLFPGESGIEAWGKCNRCRAATLEIHLIVVKSVSDKIRSWKKHLPGCSGPGASSAYCGFPQRRAAPISSANQKVQVCLTERRRFCQYEILVLSTSCRRRLSKTAPNLDRHQFNSNQVLLAASESASIWPHHPSLQNCSRVSPSECFQASLKNSINIVITTSIIIFITKLKLSGVGES